VTEIEGKGKRKGENKEKDEMMDGYSYGERRGIAVW
jgi:hypothetical protein